MAKEAKAKPEQAKVVEAKPEQAKVVEAKPEQAEGGKKHKVMVEFMTSASISKAAAEAGLQKLFDERLDLVTKPLWTAADVDGANVYGGSLKVV